MDVGGGFFDAGLPVGLEAGALEASEESLRIGSAGRKVIFHSDGFNFVEGVIASGEESFDFSAFAIGFAEIDVVEMEALEEIFESSDGNGFCSAGLEAGIAAIVH